MQPVEPWEEGSVRDSIHTMEEIGQTPLYKEDDVVEYFSNAKKIWVCGKISHSFDRDLDENLRVMYNVNVFRSGQFRRDCMADQLRPVLREDEFIELFVWRSRRWISGNIVGKPGYHGAVTGYAIQVTEKGNDEGKILNRVNASLLRRQFSPGEAIELYRDKDEGWIPATVDARGAGFAELPEPLSEFSPTAGHLEDDGCEEEGVVDHEGSEEHYPYPWAIVRIRIRASKGYRTQIVPSYRIRRSTKEININTKGG